MYSNNVEAAYCAGRIERSTDLAKAAADCCARLAHEAMAILYQRRLTGLEVSKPAPYPEQMAAQPTPVRS